MIFVVGFQWYLAFCVFFFFLLFFFLGGSCGGSFLCFCGG